MSKAFKCDICGEFKDGTSSILTFRTSEYGTDVFKCDICGSCHIMVNDLFIKIAKEHAFINMFNNPQNDEFYDD